MPVTSSKPLKNFGEQSPQVSTSQRALGYAGHSAARQGLPTQVIGDLSGPHPTL